MLPYCNFILVFHVWYFVGADKVAVFTFNKDGSKRPDSLAAYRHEIGIGGDATICTRIYIMHYRFMNAIMYALTVDNQEYLPISLDVYFEKLRPKYGGFGHFISLEQHFTTNSWYHLCLVRDFLKGQVSFFLNGKRIFEKKSGLVFDESFKKFTLGQDDSQLASYSFSGKITQTNVYNTILTDKEILEIAICKLNLEGNVVSWSGNWTLTNVNVTYEKVENLCRVSHGQNISVILPPLKFKNAVTFCRSLGGWLFHASNPEELEASQELVRKDNCSRLWGRYTDEEKEGQWANPFTGDFAKNNDVFFYKHNPDGGKYQNCIETRAYGNLDTSCSKPSCSICTIPSNTAWTLRGICYPETLMYYFDIRTSPLSFKGYGDIEIINDHNEWILRSTLNNHTIAVLFAPKFPIIPTGRHQWSLKQDVCERKPDQNVLLTLTTCPSNHYTCDDGECIHISSRCDLKFDCFDHSDERKCHLVHTPTDYQFNLPPRSEKESRLPISINFTIDCISVNTERMLLTVTHTLTMKWRDNRLIYFNLKDKPYLNSLSYEAVKKMWTPVLVFVNTNHIQKTLVDQDAVTLIKREDTRFNTNISNPYEVEIYSGSTNPIVTLRKYYTVFTCNFNLRLYPFDIQVCSLIFKSLSESNNFIIFNETDSFVSYAGIDQLIEYKMGLIEFMVDNTLQYSEMKVIGRLIRRYGYAMMSIYIPSLTLLTISFLTLFFRTELFEVRVMTALTSLLVLATLFTQAASSLPQTSYLKMVDIWLLFCIGLNFLIIVCHTIIDQHMYSEKDSVKKLNANCKNLIAFLISFSKFSVTIIFVLFNIIYWSVLAQNSGLLYGV